MGETTLILLPSRQQQEVLNKLLITSDSFKKSQKNTENANYSYWCFFAIKSIGNIVSLENLVKIVYTFVNLYTNKRGDTWDILITLGNLAVILPLLI